MKLLLLYDMYDDDSTLHQELYITAFVFYEPGMLKFKIMYFDDIKELLLKVKFPY